MAETREEFEQRVQRDSLDHLVGRIVLNADTVHASRIFLDACGEKKLMPPGDREVEHQFLDRMLPGLMAMERLPKQLVPFMIRHFGWPHTIAGVDSDPTIRADLRELLHRHARENWLVKDDAVLVGKDADRVLFTRGAIGIAGGMLLLLAVVVWKILLRTLN